MTFFAALASFPFSEDDTLPELIDFFELEEPFDPTLDCSFEGGLDATLISVEGSNTFFTGAVVPVLWSVLLKEFTDVTDEL